MPRILSPSDIATFRDRVCVVAAALLVEVGYGKFTMRDLARRLGSSAMTPYRYFANKAAILALVKIRGFSLLADRLESVLRDSDRTATERSRAFVECYLAFARDEVPFYKLMFENHPEHASDAADPDREEKRVRSLFAEYSRMLADQTGSDIDCERTGEVLWSTLHGMVVFQLTGRMAGRAANDLVDSVLSSIVAGDLSPMMDMTGTAPGSPAGNGARDWCAESEPARAALPMM